MRILLINHYAGSPSLGMEYRPHWLARNWKHAGHDVLIIAGSYSHLRRTQPTSRLFKNQCIDGVSYRILPTNPYFGNGLGRIVSMLWFGLLAWCLSGNLARWRPDVVISSSTHPFDFFAARAISKASQAKLIHEIHDLWPQTLIHIGGYDPGHVGIRVLQACEDYICKTADFIVSILPGTKRYLQSRGLSPERWVHIPNGADLQLVSSEQDSKFAADTISAIGPGTWVLGYFGGHGQSNALEHLLTAAEMLTDLRIRILLVGEGDHKQNLMERFGHLSTVVWMNAVTPSQARALMANCQALYVGFVASELYDLSGISPNKLYDYCASGRPVLEAVDSRYSHVNHIGNGYLADPRDPQQLAKAILAMSALPEEELSLVGLRGVAWVQEHANRTRLAERFLEIMKLG